MTAGTYDFNHQMRARLPYVFLFVLGLAFVLLLLTFRSLVIAATAVALNLLSVGAAYGILVAVFQHGWCAGALRLPDERRDRELAAAVPLRRPLRPLDGLPRLHPQPGQGAPRRGARRPTTRSGSAITRTAGTVTSAAIIMVAVFGLFASLSLIMMQQMGFGLAVAVLLDATVVRAVLVPSTMKLLGEWNWYLPRWLEWLPKVNAERGPRDRGPLVPPLPGT